MKFTHEKYEYLRPFGSPKHWWQLVGPKAAIHFHVSLYDKLSPSAGLEIHYFSPPKYMSEDAPSHLDCKLTGGRCWHDGTSLYASEHLWPRIEPHLKVGDHDAVFKILQDEYRSRFEKEDEVLVQNGVEE